MNNWGNISDQNYCFVQLPANYSQEQVNKLLIRFVDKHIKPVNPNYDLILQPLNEIHYDERLGNFNGRTFSKDLILALSIIGLFFHIPVNFITSQQHRQSIVHVKLALEKYWAAIVLN
jgi:hypothetical protein